MVHILHPKKEYILNSQKYKRYLIGRGQDCDLKISDISVSRNHCQIHYRDGRFYLQDSSSKFGTLVLSTGLTEIPPDSTVGMQVGRTLLVFQISKELQTEKVKAGSHI